MKKLLLFLIMGLSTLMTLGQGTSPTFKNPNYIPYPYSQSGQMINIANSYAYLNVSPFTNAFLDTITTSSTAKTIYLYTAIQGRPKVAVDTFVPFPLIGYGSISFYVTGLKISGTPAGTVTLEESSSGLPNTYVPVRASTTAGQDTLTITNVATLQGYSFDKANKHGPYFRLALIVPSSTQSTSWQASYFFNKLQYISN